jgi:predicted RNase H-like nuclease (RuvC/YqgF family)
MIRGLKFCVLACVVLCLAPGWSRAQKPDTTDTSLGNLARQVRAEKSKETKATKVFTNDNLSVAAQIKENAAEKPPGKPAAEAGVESKEKAETNSAAEAKGVHDEKYYRTRLSELQGRLDLHKRELDVLQQKVNLNQMQYYNDPNKALQQEYTRGDINQLNQDIEAKKQQIADDEKAIEDLHDQLRREGGDPGWLR